ncbi:MAG: PEP-utilizing enzyme [Planctomycetales bacterium]
MNIKWTYALNELDASHVGIAGGKGSSLGELMRCGAPVPSGFVVSSAAFESFMVAARAEQSIDEVTQQLAAGQIEASEASNQIYRQLDEVEVSDEVVSEVTAALVRLDSERVSVRSSATCEDGTANAWAGQLETFLNVPHQDVADRIRACWLSIFSPSALAYGVAHGISDQKIAVAVVVQKMVDSEVSGIAFSVHPVTQEPDILLIEACLGLGEAIVSGAIVPDQYIVQRGTTQITERAVGGQQQGLFLEPGAAEATWRQLGPQGDIQKLTDQQITEYANLLVKIQDHYGFPVDTEWALADGQFQVLQSRPITTLADEYRETIIDTDIHWQQLVRRPMPLIEISIWAHWLDSQHVDEAFGFSFDRALSIQDETGLAIVFLPQEDTSRALDSLLDMVRTARSQVVEILQRGHAIHRDAQARIDRGAIDFENLDEAADFFADVAQHTTVFPAWILMVYEQNNMDDPEIRSLAEGLRIDSLYPAIERQIIDPIVTEATSQLGFSAPSRASEVTTWSELRNGTLDLASLESRLQQVDSGRRFVFQSIDGNDSVRFLSQTGFLLTRVSNQRKLASHKRSDELSGQVAWPGICRARARVILSSDTEGQTIEDGEILVSIQSSPALMPLLERCGAIVTDDGGIACHAAIISRELRKPTLIGTRFATTVIHTGDLVEVDTYDQVVRIIERAEISQVSGFQGQADR